MTSRTDATLTTVFEVKGMTCSHCVAAVTGELLESVPGIEQVEIELQSGQVKVFSRRELAADAISQAVDDAGYELVPGTLRLVA